MEKKSILLITNGFPFKNSERGFLPTEFDCLKKEFDIYILARNPAAAREDWEHLDYDASKIWVAEDKPLQPFSVFLQLFRADVLGELLRAALAGGGIQIFLKRVSLILRYGARAQEYQKHLEKICEKHHIDMVYSYWCTQATLAAVRMIPSHKNLKVITRFHGYDLYNERLPELWQPYRHLIASRCELLVYACRKGAEYFKKEWQETPEEKMVVSYLGCPPKKQVSTSGNGVLHLISCSNLIPLKRVELIIQALSQVSDQVKVEWHHYGDGVLRESLEKLARDLLSEKENISWTFHGVVPNQELNSCYRENKAEAFITTSSTEGVPVSIQEAMAMGIPAIATDVGGISELVISGRTGWLLPPDPKVSEITEMIEKAACYEERKILGQGALQLWEESFNSEKTAEEFRDLILSAVLDKE